MPKVLGRRVSALNLTLALVLVAIVGVGGYLAFAPQGSDASATTSTTATAVTTDVTSTVTASGTAEPSATKDVSFDADGTVKSIKVKVGDTVTKGDVIATATNDTASQKVESAQASYSSALANYASVKSATKKAKAVEKNAQRSSAWSQVVSARLARTEAEDAVSGLTLHAPASGTITVVNGSVGESTTSTSSSSDSTSGTSTSTAFVTIANLKKYVVTGTFSETDVAKIKEGEEATIAFNSLPNDTYAGKVKAIDLSASTTDGVTTYGVTVSVADPPESLRQGATATITVTTGSATNVVAVPTSSVTTTNGASTVTLVTGGKSVTTTVEIGVEGDTYTEITSGLSAGDKVALGATSSSSSSGSGFPGGGFPGGGAGGGAPAGLGGAGAGRG
ncbi:efflux RND transporter periplasmic adaptor subunit [soil metagenome]